MEVLQRGKTERQIDRERERKRERERERYIYIYKVRLRETSRERERERERDKNVRLRTFVSLHGLVSATLANANQKTLKPIWCLQP